MLFLSCIMMGYIYTHVVVQHHGIENGDERFGKEEGNAKDAQNRLTKAS